VANILLTRDLFARIDARAAALGMPRSRYLAVLAKADVDRGGKLIIDPEPTPGEVDSGIEIAKFLEIAVPALADYELRRKNPRRRAARLSRRRRWRRPSSGMTSSTSAMKS